MLAVGRVGGPSAVQGEVGGKGASEKVTLGLINLVKRAALLVM